MTVTKLAKPKMQVAAKSLDTYRPDRQDNSVGGMAVTTKYEE